MLLVNLSVGRIQSTLTTGAEEGTVFVKKHAPSGPPAEVKGYWCKGRNSHCAGQVSLAAFTLSCIDQKVERLKTESHIVF